MVVVPESMTSEPLREGSRACILSQRETKPPPHGVFPTEQKVLAIVFSFNAAHLELTNNDGGDDDVREIPELVLLLSRRPAADHKILRTVPYLLRGSKK
mmetsp:Transcript_27608/g.57166  ORF Transcript_27608/g.57166 Transcript_27608/m.57166 type:complete len:99 (-) Transcript_27608:232-528(-)